MIKKDYYVAAYNLCLMFPSEQPTRISLSCSSTVIDFTNVPLRNYALTAYKHCVEGGCIICCRW